jgi:hypothetical protein
VSNLSINNLLSFSITNIIINNNQHSRNLHSSTDFKNLLFDLWFAPYRRYTANDSSGFEHVFVVRITYCILCVLHVVYDTLWLRGVCMHFTFNLAHTITTPPPPSQHQGEEKQGSITGLHNWLR